MIQMMGWDAQIMNKLSSNNEEGANYRTRTFICDLLYEIKDETYKAAFRLSKQLQYFISLERLSTIPDHEDLMKRLCELIRARWFVVNFVRVENGYYLNIDWSNPIKEKG